VLAYLCICNSGLTFVEAHYIAIKRIIARSASMGGIRVQAAVSVHVRIAVLHF
jgi:hypothetical protein